MATITPNIHSQFAATFNAFLATAGIGVAPQTLINNNLPGQPWHPFIMYADENPPPSELEDYVPYHCFANIPFLADSGSRIASRFILGMPPDQWVSPEFMRRASAPAGLDGMGFFQEFLRVQIAIEAASLGPGWPATATPLLMFARNHPPLISGADLHTGGIPSAIRLLKSGMEKDTIAAQGSLMDIASALAGQRRFTAAALTAEIAAYSIKCLLEQDMREIDIASYDGENPEEDDTESLHERLGTIEEVAAHLWYLSLDEYLEPESLPIRLLQGLINAYHGSEYGAMADFLDVSARYYMKQGWSHHVAEDYIRKAWVLTQMDDMDEGRLNSIIGLLRQAASIWRSLNRTDKFHATLKLSAEALKMAAMEKRRDR